MVDRLLFFLKTASLDNLQIGQTGDVVKQIIGDISDVYEEPSSGWSIIRHKEIELLLENDTLSRIQVNLLSIDALHFSGISKETPLYKLLELMDQNHVKWEVEPELSFDQQLCIRTEADVIALFNLENRILQTLVTDEKPYKNRTNISC